MPEDGPIYFEDLAVDQRRDLGSHEFTADGIRSFASEWDPLALHIDDDPEGLYEEPVASGVHVLAVVTRLAVAAYRRDLAPSVGLGIDDLRWRRPVRPGDELEATATVAGTRPSESRPGFGVVRERIEGRVEGEVAIGYTGAALVGRRRDG